MSILSACLAVSFALLSAPASSAHHNPGHGGGPGGGGEDPPAPIDGGWIYSHGDTNPEAAIFRTDPEGTSTWVVSGAPASYYSGNAGIPSHAPKDGDRWYVAYRVDSVDPVFPGVQGPYPQLAREIDAVRQGDPTGVPLTDLRGACIYAAGFWPGWTTADGGTPDTAAAFLGAQWRDLDANPDDCESFEAAGIFRLPLLLDPTTGAVTGAGTPVLEVPVPIDTYYNLSHIGDGNGWAWSPDGASAVYSEGGSIWLAAAGSPLSARTELVPGIGASYLDWSGDQDAGTAGMQTTIAFSGREGAPKYDAGLWTVKPDGSGLTMLRQGRDAKNSKQTNITFSTPFWSPAGTHIGYVENEFAIPLVSQHRIHRMAADGSDDAQIADDTVEQDIRRLLSWTDED